MNLVFKTLSMSALAISLSACQSLRGPKPVTDAQIPTSFNYSVDGVSIAQQGYKTYFADPRLIQVLDLALANNRDLRTAALNIQKAQQQYQISESALLPTIGVSGSVIRQNNILMQEAGKPFTFYNAGVGLTAYELDFWGRVRSLKDAALDTYLSTQQARDATQIGLISQVTQAWLNYAYASANLKLSEQTLQTQLEAYNLNKKRFDVGIDSELPLRQSQIAVETARSDVANFKTQIAQAQNLLNLLVGQPVSPDLLPTEPVKQVTSSTVFSTGLPSELLSNRPDIKAAEFQLRAAGANIGAARARLFPTITLTGNGGFASMSFNDLFRSGGFVWSAGPNIDLPIFDWGARRANIKVTETDQKIAVANYEKTIQTAFREVNDALAVRANIDERLSAQRNLVEATNVTYQLATQRFRAGIDSYLTVLDAQRSFYAAQQGLLVLEQADQNNQVELYKSVGGGVKAQ